MRMRPGGNNPHNYTPYNKYKLRPTEPTLNNYGRTKEMDAYLQKIAHYKNEHPDNIIFRNKNLNKDFKIAMEKVDETVAQQAFGPNPNDEGITFYTMSPYTPTKPRDPPKNFSNVSVSTAFFINSPKLVIVKIPQVQEQ